MTTERSNNNWVMTVLGKKVYPLDPKVEDIHIFDIAFALNNLCRYTGHCRNKKDPTRNKISVLQHSILVSQIIGMSGAPSVEHELAGLLHDSSEAYINDVNSPTKHGPGMEGYKAIEHGIQRVIEQKFNLTEGILSSKVVKYADQVALTLETENGFDDYSEWHLMVVPESIRERLQDFDYFGGSTEDYLRRFTILEEQFKESKNG